MGERGSRIDGLYFGEPQPLIEALAGKYGRDAVDMAFEGRCADMRISIVYYPQINSYRGNESMQVIIDEGRI